MAKEKAEKESQVLLDQGIFIAERLKIKKILVVGENLILWRVILPYVEKYQFMIVLSRKKLAEGIPVETFLCDFRGVARSDRLDYIIRSAVESDKLKRGEKVLCLYSLSGRRLLDTLRVIKIENQYGHISPYDLRRIGKTIPVDVLYAVVNLAMEIGQEGREGSAVGTILVVGDSARVLGLSKPMIFDPFLGYPEEERQILDPKVKESVKELTLLDGAFIVREDGAIMSAGRYLHAGAGKTALIKGLGARHAAAAAISFHTDAVAVTVSESTGTVRIFSGGKIAMTIRTYRPHLSVKKR